MKRPKHMNMNELIALPILEDGIPLRANGEALDSGYGGAFRDEGGHVWGTLRLKSGWVRYPAHLPLVS